MHIVNSVLT